MCRWTKCAADARIRDSRNLLCASLAGLIDSSNLGFKHTLWRHSACVTVGIFFFLYFTFKNSFWGRFWTLSRPVPLVIACEMCLFMWLVCFIVLWWEHGPWLAKKEPHSYLSYAVNFILLSNTLLKLQYTCIQWNLVRRNSLLNRIGIFSKQ